MSTAAELIASNPNVLMDFDGPICSVFGGVTAEWVAVELRRRLGLTDEHSTDSRDPFDILRYAAAEGAREAAEAECELTRLEVQAVETAVPTPAAGDVLAALAAAGHTIAVVSNNSAAAVAAYLASVDLEDQVRVISARRDADPELLKPSPYLLMCAMARLGAKPAECVMVGDSIADVKAARAAEVAVIAYVNKPHKREQFAAHGGDRTIEAMYELLGAAP